MRMGMELLYISGIELKGSQGKYTNWKKIEWKENEKQINLFSNRRTDILLGTGWLMDTA